MEQQAWHQDEVTEAGSLKYLVWSNFKIYIYYTYI